MFRRSSNFFFGSGFLARASLFELMIGFLLSGFVGKLIVSIFEDVVLPLIAVVMGGLNFSEFYIQLTGTSSAKSLEEARQMGATLAYGNLITVALNLLILLAIVLPLVFWARRGAKVKNFE